MQLKIGEVLDGKVSSITKFGAFVELPAGKTGMIHISEVAASFVKDINDHLKVGQEVKVKLINIDDNGRVSLSIKQLQLEERARRRKAEEEAEAKTAGGVGEWTPRKREFANFDEMMNRFKQDSEEKMSAIRRQTDGKRGNRRK